MVKKWIKAIAVVGAAAFLFAGCSATTAASSSQAATSASAAATASVAASASANTAGAALDLNSMSLDQITAEAKKEGQLNTVGMPDSWANWGQTWQDITSKYGIKHTDKDMSSAEELAVFQSEGQNATKDLGDIGMSFGPQAVSQGLTQPYKTTHWSDIPDWAKDKDGNWIIGYYGTISIMTNTKLVPTAPKSFQDILNGTYKVSIGDVTKASQAQCAVLAAAVALGGSETNLKPGIDFFAKLAQQGRLDKGDLTIDRLQKGEVAVAFLWDYNALGYKQQIKASDPSSSFEVNIPSEGSIQSGYCTVINKYSKNPAAAALAREYILSDAGQINLARGFAKPIRSNVTLPDDVKAQMISNDQYKNARIIKDMEGWAATAKTIGNTWQDQVIAVAK
ncbi:MAG: ABC transporter substrate-binding protein [Eubacteriales bacterium]